MSAPLATIPRRATSWRTAGWCLALGALAALVLPRLLTRGLYDDGNIYALLSRNIAAGVGWEWDPHASPAMHPHFREHPALMFVWQSWWFRVLGDHFWVEKLYSLALVLAIVPFLARAWRREGGAGAHGALPLLLWMMVPAWPWMARNNMIENQVILLGLGAVICLLEARDRAAHAAWPWWLAGGALLAGSALTKGPPGLFPLVLPAAFAVAGRWPWRRAIRDCAGILVATGLALTLALLEPSVREQVFGYLRNQLGASLAGNRTEISAVARPRMLTSLVEQALPLLAVGVACALLAWRRGWPLAWRGAAAWALVGLSASLPLLAVSRFSTHYLAVSMPFFALAAAVPAAQVLARLAVQPWTERMLRPVLALGLFAALGGTVACVILAGRPWRTEDRDAYAAMAVIAPVVGDGAMVGADEGLRLRFSLRHHLMRSHWIVLDPELHPRAHRHFLASSSAAVPAGYRPLPHPLPRGWVLAERERGAIAPATAGR